jgi:hypothetical protein
LVRRSLKRRVGRVQHRWPLCLGFCDPLAECPLVDHGVARATAQQPAACIAERAGVSIGSLYRYFPDRDSIAEALVAGWLEDLMNTFWQSDPPSQTGSFIEQAIDTYAAVFRRIPGFRQVFYAAQPRAQAATAEERRRSRRPAL